jgi:hypothetical protein
MSGADPRLLDFAATDRQREFIQAIIDHGSQRAAAKATGVHKKTIHSALDAARKRAARQGYSPDHDMTRPVAPGFALRGTSTLYDKGGAVALQWVKTTRDHQAQHDAMIAAAEAMAEELPRVAPVTQPAGTDAELLNAYTVSDLHVGMLAWRHEAGSDWDLSQAERILIGCFSRMVASAPSADGAVVALLGDFLHWDGLEAVTPTSRNILDADGRFSKVVPAAIRLIRTVVDMALAKHGRVRLLIAEGNHDLASSVWLRHMFSALYDAEPRLIVNTSPAPFYAYQHGRTMLGYHHGHTVKPASIGQVMATEFPAIWGATTYRYVHMGHRHSSEVREPPGIVVEQHQTLAARDAYASRHGYHAQRGAVGVTYHREYGEVGRVVVRPEMAMPRDA